LLPKALDIVRVDCVQHTVGVTDQGAAERFRGPALVGADFNDMLGPLIADDCVEQRLRGRRQQ
jgi:hypothetical protein